MTIQKPAITILVNQKYTTIELHDKKSGITFLELQLTPEQLSSALSRLAYTPVDTMEVHNLDKLNKVMTIDTHEFQMPETVSYSERRDEAAILAFKTCPEGWEPDTSFNSQNSFFREDGKEWARTMIRKWE